MASVIQSPIDERLRGWLEGNEIAYQIHEHPLAYTALATAHAEGVDPATFAKVVGVRTEAGRVALVVLDAVDAVDLGKVADLVGSPVRLMNEHELADACPGWEVGTTAGANPCRRAGLRRRGHPGRRLHQLQRGQPSRGRATRAPSLGGGGGDHLRRCGPESVIGG